ncbi:MAG TPA: hypothetical protein VLG28_03740 [Acidimicrobiia bacterium]|jgi:cytochrome c-type biogenesis protein CcmH/NrfF|nr:hypothetical protein [Acidimicrobiia bacterium]
MDGWGWVLWGYGLVIVVLGVYVWSLAMRTRTARRRLDEIS